MAYPTITALSVLSSEAKYVAVLGVFLLDNFGTGAVLYLGTASACVLFLNSVRTEECRGFRRGSSSLGFSHLVLLLNLYAESVRWWGWVSWTDSR